MQGTAQSRLQIRFDLLPHLLVCDWGSLKRFHLQGIDCYPLTRRINLRSEDIESIPTQRPSNHGEYTAAFSNANRHIGEPARKILLIVQDHRCPEPRLCQHEMPSDLVWRSSTKIPSGHGIKKAIDVLHAVLRTKRFQNGGTQALAQFLHGGWRQRALTQQVIERPPIE